jgi:hypothetical protein
MTSTSTDWPFDAYQDDPLAALRIPVVGSPYPRWRYEVALCCPNSPAGQDLYPSLRPDEAEVRQIVAYIGYRMEWYNEGWRAKMRESALDVDSGTNTVTLIKRGEGDWQYVKATWRHGPWPFYDAPERYALGQLLDRINDFSGRGDQPNPRWQAWKDAHPEAFGERTGS